MKRNTIIFLSCVLLAAAGFYLLPLCGIDYMMLLLIYLPIICAGSSAMYGLMCGMSFVLAPVYMLLFVPCLFIYYNYTAMIYMFLYYASSLLGVAAGAQIRKLLRK